MSRSDRLQSTLSPSQIPRCYGMILAFDITVTPQTVHAPAQYFSYSLAKDVYVFEVTASLEVQAHEEGLIIGGLLHALTLTGFLCVHPDLVALLQLVVGLLVVFLVQLARCHAQVFLNHQSQVFKLQGKLQC